MILRNATIKYKGYDPNFLSVGSHKRICVSCDMCGKVRYIEFKHYRNLCKSCVKMGNKNPNYGKHWSNEVKDKISKSSIGKNLGKNNANYGNHRLIGSKNPNWKGGVDLSRPYVLPEVQCTKLNKKFKNSEFHHLTKSYGVYIPKILHRHIWHSLKSSQGMDEMSILAFQFIKGEL